MKYTSPTWTRWLAGSVFVLVITAAAWGDGGTLDGASIKRLQVSPSRLQLHGRRSGTQLLVTAFDASGAEHDVTRQVQIATSDLFAIDATGYVRPVHNGKGELKICLQQHALTIPIEVSAAAQETPISFRWETLAVLTKQGCNSGACHGKPNGRGALELSLNAYDAQFDEESLIRSGFARFTEPLVPSESLLLKKPTLRLPHGGGKRLRLDDDLYRLLYQWIDEGCQPEPDHAPTCVRLEVEPATTRVLHLAHSPQQQFRVSAHFSDGSVTDVTRIATWTLSHADVGSVDRNGLFLGQHRGQAAVSVRYLDEVMSVPVTVIEDVAGFVWNDPVEFNEVDRWVHEKLRQLQYLPAALCDDSTFLRRLSLDVRGLLPTPDETRAFLSDPSSDKRSRWIDRCLDSLEFASFWSLKMADLLRVNRQQLTPEQATAFSQWIYHSVAENQPFDEFCRELLTVQGLASQHPAANYYRVTSDTKEVAESISQVFMGARIMCAQCHNHPYEKWTQDNYYQLATVFHQLDRKLADAESSTTNTKVADLKKGDLRLELTFDRDLPNPRTGRVQPPWPIDVPRAADEDRRVAFAQWLTRRDNPFFAPVMVNRIWADLFGQGLVNPIDDFRSSNPSVNAELLTYLAREFTRANYDRKYLIRLLLNSATYQRASTTNEFNASDQQLASHARIRLLSAEQIQDAVVRLCDGEERRKELLRQQAAMLDPKTALLNDGEQQFGTALAQLEGYFMTQQPYPQLTPFLKAFGQPERQTACACERRTEVSLDQALQFMNSALIRERVAYAARRLAALNDLELIEELTIAAFSRSATAAEFQAWSEYLSGTTPRVEALEDIIWTVINTHEFMFQH